MKKISLFLILSAIVLTGCSSSKHSLSNRFYKESIDYCDYTPYVNKGFLFSEANSVKFDYQEIGSLYGVVFSGIREQESGRYTPGSPDYIRYATLQNALDMMYKKAVELGADGIINLKYEYSFTEDVMVISGVAIKK